MHELAIGQRVQVYAPGTRWHGKDGTVHKIIHAELLVGVDFGTGPSDWGWYYDYQLLPIYTGAEVVKAIVEQGCQRQAAEYVSATLTPPKFIFDPVAYGIWLDLMLYSREPVRTRTTQGVSCADSILPGDPRSHR